MNRFASRVADLDDFKHGEAAKIGVIIANLGTPDAPDARSLRRYLREFLSDPRVVEVPRPIWWLVLNLVILNIRPKKSAHAYSKVWTEQGSPLLVNSLAQESALAQRLRARTSGPVNVRLAMRYGSPSIASAIEAFRQDDVRQLFVLPLYPQYSGSTTASVFDAVFDALKKERWVPEVRTVNAYYEHAGYIDALAQSIRRHRDQHGDGQHLLFSFHGIPKRYFAAGDPYHCHCHATANRVAGTLGLAEEQWSIGFQSRFGREPWLQPYTDVLLKEFPKRGIESVDVVCPGFASDCVETLEEIDIENREYFRAAGGATFRYIPALNADDAHIEALADIVVENIEDWDRRASGIEPKARAEGKQRAQDLGAPH